MPSLRARLFEKCAWPEVNFVHSGQGDTVVHSVGRQGPSDTCAQHTENLLAHEVDTGAMARKHVKCHDECVKQ